MKNTLIACSIVAALLPKIIFASQINLPYPLDGKSIPLGDGRFGNCVSLVPTTNFSIYRGGSWPYFFTGSIDEHSAVCITTDKDNHPKSILETAGTWVQCEKETDAKPIYEGTPYAKIVGTYQQDETGGWHFYDDAIKCKLNPR